MSLQRLSPLVTLPLIMIISFLLTLFSFWTRDDYGLSLFLRTKSRARTLASTSSDCSSSDWFGKHFQRMPQQRRPCEDTCHPPQLSDNNNICETHWAHYWWNAKLLHKPARLRTFISDTHIPGMNLQEQPGSCLILSATTSEASAQMGYGLLCGCEWALTNKPSTMLFFNVQSVDLTDSGLWDNQMAAQNLSRDLQ